jgi:hypothetical protein
MKRQRISEVVPSNAWVLDAKMGMSQILVRCPKRSQRAAVCGILLIAVIDGLKVFSEPITGPEDCKAARFQVRAVCHYTRKAFMIALRMQPGEVAGTRNSIGPKMATMGKSRLSLGRTAATGFVLFLGCLFFGVDQQYLVRITMLRL